MRFPLLLFHSTALCRRLRDPQVQVWMMAGVSVLLVLIGHLRAWNPSGEGKNEVRLTASRLLLAGARMEWSEDFAAVTPRPEARPVLVLAANPSPPRKTPAPAAAVLQMRPAMQAAASQPWQALDRPLRLQLSHAGIPAAPLKIRLRWSGDARGNAALVARHPIPSTAACESSSGLVIGNGSRSGDGEIEWLSPAMSLNPADVEITLIGPCGRTSPSQLSALAELLVHLEAMSGHRLETPPAGAGAGNALVL